MGQLLMFEAQPVTPLKLEVLRFEELWKSWGNKAKKPLALAKYRLIVGGTLKTRTFERDSNSYVEIELAASEAEIIAGAAAYMRSQLDLNTFKLKDGGRYIPMLSTWLNGGRWSDFT